jgi:hypothetical protein
MTDPATGRDRLTRALGEFTPRRGVRTDGSRNKAFTGNSDDRMINNGLISGPRQSFQRYNVGKNATDAINRGKPTLER